MKHIFILTTLGTKTSYRALYSSNKVPKMVVVVDIKRALYGHLSVPCGGWCTIIKCCVAFWDNAQEHYKCMLQKPRCPACRKNLQDMKPCTVLCKRLHRARSYAASFVCIGWFRYKLINYQWREGARGERLMYHKPCRRLCLKQPASGAVLLHVTAASRRRRS